MAEGTQKTFNIGREVVSGENAAIRVTRLIISDSAAERLSTGVGTIWQSEVHSDGVICGRNPPVSRLNLALPDIADAPLPAGRTRTPPLRVVVKGPLPSVSVGSHVVVTLEDAMRAHILKALAATRGKVAGRGGAADLLGVNPKTLESKIRKLGITQRWA